MNITILHSPFSPDSRALVESLGVTIPEGNDVTVTVGTDTVRIVSDHDTAVGVCFHFGGYPTALVESGGVTYQLAFPASWTAVTAWAASPPAAADSIQTTEMSRTRFLARFTAVELVAARELAKTDSVIDLFWMQLLAADVVDLAYQPVINGVRYLVGKLAGFDETRANQVLGVIA
jgi:hypothetical protein